MGERVAYVICMCIMCRRFKLTQNGRDYLEACRRRLQGAIRGDAVRFVLRIGDLPRAVAHRHGFRSWMGCTHGRQAIARPIFYWSVSSPTHSDRREVRRISWPERYLLHHLGSDGRRSRLRRTGLLRRAHQDRRRAAARARQILTASLYDCEERATTQSGAAALSGLRPFAAMAHYSQWRIK